MKAITATLLVLFSVLPFHFALGASTPDRPAGVDAQHWIPVSDKMGPGCNGPSISSWRPSNDGPASTAARTARGRLLHGTEWDRLAADYHPRPPQGTGHVGVMLGWAKNRVECADLIVYQSAHESPGDSVYHPMPVGPDFFHKTEVECFEEGK